MRKTERLRKLDLGKSSNRGRRTPISCRSIYLTRRLMLSKRARSLTATMRVSVRVTWHVRVRFMLSDKWELKPFANVSGIRSLGHELSSKPLHKQQYLLSDRVDKHHVCKIDN